ncbi:hypothetical protein AB833_07085 [Chromatiales bacterium (ex Bugula neritina AB1)]|nr:hypothetical protein AB833_07085 [Chromatiales bacterium (ex Bugula neritina AB1)]
MYHRKSGRHAAATVDAIDVSPMRRNCIRPLCIGIALACLPIGSAYANLAELCHSVRLVTNSSMDSSVLINAVPNATGPDGWSVVNSPDRVDVGVTYEIDYVANPFSLFASPDGGTWTRLVDNANNFQEQIYQQVTGLRPGSNFYVRYYQARVATSFSRADGGFLVQLGENSIVGPDADPPSGEPQQGGWSEAIVGPFIAKFEEEKLSITANSAGTDSFVDLFLDGVRICTIDADNDGLLDVLEDANRDGVVSNDDSDGDGVPNYLDTDSDNDGLSDGEETFTKQGNNPAPDADNDGIPDSVDVTETGGVDANGDGVDDAVINRHDLDGDGFADYIDPDSDGDGVPDKLEGKNDFDGDGQANYRDTDSDNDGISDTIESGALLIDSDGDGIDDAFDEDSPNSSSVLRDSESDGVPDMFDVDTDNDGLPDILEDAGDVDNDGFPNYRDLDSDNDSIADFVEATVPGASNRDTDRDGIPDLFDVTSTGGEDANGDGIDDSFSFVSSDDDDWPDHHDPDSDGDGVPDIYEGTADLDGDGISNYLDDDSDGDGISDAIEGGSLGSDSDGDGLDDYFDVDHTGGVDSNGDGVDDAVLPPDANNDGRIDMMDIFDSDDDGIPDVLERIGDTDGDGLSDSRDSDSDGDGIADGVEAGLTGFDFDNDGIDNLMDVDQTGGEDANGDGIDDAFMLADFDNDGLPNHVDLDSDGDGIPDAEETGDLDFDGIADYLDTDPFSLVTGTRGSGCTLTGAEASVDPLLGLLIAGAAAGLARRRKTTF